MKHVLALSVVILFFLGACAPTPSSTVVAPSAVPSSTAQATKTTPPTVTSEPTKTPDMTQTVVALAAQQGWTPTPSATATFIPNSPDESGLDLRGGTLARSSMSALIAYTTKVNWGEPVLAKNPDKYCPGETVTASFFLWGIPREVNMVIPKGMSEGMLAWWVFRISGQDAAMPVFVVQEQVGNKGCIKVQRIVRFTANQYELYQQFFAGRP